MVKGRLPRESNPLSGDKSGFVASHDTTGDEDYKRTSPLNPLPVKSIGDSNVKDAAVKAELELIKQGIADNKSTNDLILARLDNPFDTYVTGSYVEDGIVVKQAGNIVESSHIDFTITAGAIRRFSIIFNERVSDVIVSCSHQGNAHDPTATYVWSYAGYSNHNYATDNLIESQHKRGFASSRLPTVGSRISIELRNTSENDTTYRVNARVFGNEGKQATFGGIGG